MAIYVVQTGDDVDTVSASQNVPVQDVIFDNQLIYPYELAVGQALYIRGEEREDALLQTNGYAYPFISSWVLGQTLPYLSRLSVFSYGFTTNGDLIPPPLDETYMIDLAYQYGVMPIMTLTPFDESGIFNNMLISALVGSREAKSNLISEILTLMQSKRYQGVDVDFEYILARDRDAFGLFVEELTQALNAQGHVSSVALAPKTSADQQGLLYEGKDYRQLGLVADQVLLMTYEWGYTYGPPMAVAPINRVREVVDYAVSEIDPAKISLGIPNYGYDWTLPYVRGQSRARTIGNVEAVRLAIRYGAQILFDETAMSPFFTYSEDGLTHEVWFEDVRSMQAKFDLIREYGLHGAGYWQIMQLFRANWLQLAENFRILRGNG
ncbi:MAG: glycoside hydrolase [Lachnospiraceae bacterium]|nr:glycoside hydrolase [Lachnospiraceae bacterium]